MAYPHERRFDSLHDRLPYLPIVDRDPIRWPGDAKVAIWIVPNIEHYEYLPPEGAFDPYPRTPHPEVRKYAYHDYGNRVGFWRMLEVMDRYEIRCTVSLNIAVFDHYPEIRDAIIEREWGLMSHGLYNTRFLTGLTPTRERQALVQCNRVLERHIGRQFDGMLGPFITGNRHTPDLMAEVGMRYHADWVHDELPSPMSTTPPSRLVALPYSYELNDAPLLMRSHVEGPAYVERCIAQLDRLQRDAADGGRMMCLPLHPFAIGQPHRIRYLDQLLGHLRDQDDLWIARASDIVDHYLEHHYDADLASSSPSR